MILKNLQQVERVRASLAVLLVAALCSSQNLEAQNQTVSPECMGPALADQAPAQPGELPQVETDRDVSWKGIVPNILQDQKSIWLFPAQIPKHRNWIPVAVVVGATAGLIALDPITGHYFRNASTYNGFNKVFTSNATAIGTAIGPLALYGAGLIRGNSKMKKTALFAGEAVADSEILTIVFKDIDRRLRPVSVRPGGNFADTWLDSGGSPLRGNGSFPSGHSIAAFSVATVVAHQYRNHRWVPFVAYGLAGLVGFSRLTLSAHFLSDVAVGGVLGYSISRFAVLRQ
jgi:membrane-associated phospholipid phosphatase